MNAHQRRIEKRRQDRLAEDEFRGLGISYEELELWASNVRVTAAIAGLTICNPCTATITILGVDNSGRKLFINQ